MGASGQYKWFVVAMLWCVCFLNYADRQLIFTVFPLLGKEFQLTDASLSVLSASFMCAYAVFGPLGGFLCDRVSRRTLVLGALIFWSVTTALTSYAHSYLLLVAGIALGGLGEAFYFPSAMSLIADYHSVDTRSRAMALHQSSVYIGSIAGGAAAGYLGEHYGWRLGFRIFGLAGILLGGALWLFLKEPLRGMSDAAAGVPPSASRLWDGLRAVSRNPAAWLLIGVFIGANFVAMIFTVWMPTFLFRKFHMSLSLSGLNGTAYLQIASVIGVISGGFLADSRVRQRKGDRGARMAVQSFGLFCGVPFLFLSGWTTIIAAVMAAMIGFGLFKGIYDSNIWAALYDVTPIELRGTALGLMNSLGWLGGAAAQLCIGLASKSFGLSACLSATAVIYLCIAIALWVGSRRISRTQLS
jgi:MFS family permease